MLSIKQFCINTEIVCIVCLIIFLINVSTAVKGLGHPVRSFLKICHSHFESQSQAIGISEGGGSTFMLGGPKTRKVV